MTRYTDFGRKRTHVQAGFDELDPPSEAASSALAATDTTDPAAPANTATAPPVKKKRKRTPKSKRDNYGQGKPANPGPSAREASEQDGQKTDGAGLPSTVAEGNKKKDSRALMKAKRNRRKDAQARKAASEDRRQKRISARTTSAICLACRQQGHLARDCPTAGADSPLNKLVGICYRCGSKKHTLSKCKTPVDTENPLPFASCFVCSGTGHLASACPQNATKGVYPNGGCCKLCGEVSHLAKNCNLRKDDPANRSEVVGTGGEAGADEDDFHILGRKKHEVDHEEKREKRAKRVEDVKVGALTGTVRPLGNAPAIKARKVVTF